MFYVVSINLTLTVHYLFIRIVFIYYYFFYHLIDGIYKALSFGFWNYYLSACFSCRCNKKGNNM